MQVIQHQSPTTKMAVGLLNSVISEAIDQLPPPPSTPSSNNNTHTSTSPLNALNNIIGEMEAVTCHKNTSVENLGRNHVTPQKEERPIRFSMRREASREIAATLTGELKRPDEDGAPVPGKREIMRREASQDLSTSVTGDLKRPDTEGEEDVILVKRGSHLRREASSDLSPTLLNHLKRPEENEASPRKSLVPSPKTNRNSSPSPRGEGIAFFKSSSISEDFEGEAIRRDDDTLTTTATATTTKQYAEDAVTVNWLDLRVGRILSATHHESADKLYCESIDVGEDQPRSIASGLVPYYSLEEMQDRLVVVVCNLKSRNLVGFPSNGMVLCATSESDGDRKVELLTPPAGAKPGDRVFAPDVPGEMVTPQKCDKKKIFPKVAVALKVDESGRLMWDDVVLSVAELPAGTACTAPTLRNTEVG